MLFDLKKVFLPGFYCDCYRRMAPSRRKRAGHQVLDRLDVLRDERNDLPQLPLAPVQAFGHTGVERGRELGHHRRHGLVELRR